ncbi:hypothetical protein RGR602_PA00053 (plasmid) [Rhizobium gallicum bv. gallicum R602sp]|uniref:Uncharacterized protein n=2 Tax=Rhizobium gallicum TaxID=56730 RepID=A0A0B4X5L2_9HYPH|nr:hypothetical protein RGR602_PA00053 [Rhizobium gallicum bv. gallicum R602sp]
MGSIALMNLIWLQLARGKTSASAKNIPKDKFTIPTHRIVALLDSLLIVTSAPLTFVAAFHPIAH